MKTARLFLSTLLAFAVIVGVYVTLGEVGSAQAQSADATLSSLVLADADSTTVALDQTFASGTTSYTTTVEYDIDTITVTPTTSDSGAGIEYLDNSDSPLPMQTTSPPETSSLSRRAPTP